MAAEQSGRVTRKDVAHLAGVSTAVVSYVINDGPRPVAEQTRKRVLAAIEKLGYRPNALARAVKLGKTSTVGILVPDVVEPFHSWVVRDLDQRFQREGFSTLLANVHDSAAQEWNAANELVSRGIDFLVVLMSSIPDSQWREAKFPVPVAMMDRQRELPGFLTVGADFIDGGVKCTQHLIAHGRRQIVPVFGEFTRGDENNRYTGYLQAVKDASLPAVTPIICEWNMDGGYQAGIEYLSRGGVDYADGIFCFSDSIAFGFLRALRENNVHIPEQAALIGFDGIGLGKYAAPALATLAQPIHEMVDFIVRILVAESGAELPSGLQKFPVKLVPAASCGCI